MCPCHPLARTAARRRLPVLARPQRGLEPPVELRKSSIALQASVESCFQYVTRAAHSHQLAHNSSFTSAHSHQLVHVILGGAEHALSIPRITREPDVAESYMHFHSLAIPARNTRAGESINANLSAQHSRHAREFDSFRRSACSCSLAASTRWMVR